VFGFDEAAPQIAMWDGNDTATDVTGSLLFTDITSALLGGGTTPAFSATVWRGMKARTTATPNQSEVFLASATADYGVVRVVVDKATPASVTGWQFFE
jgi:hypothetical protein